MIDKSHQPQPDQKPSGAQMLLESAAERLPTPDGVALAIMEAWENERTTAQDLARLVQTDPALSGRVLKLANSAAVGRRAVVSVPECIVRIGMHTVGQLAVAFSLIGKESENDCPAFDRQQYWARCLLMAVLSRGLGEATRLAPPEDLFACGLLARIGVLGLASVYPEAYSEILSANSDKLTTLEKESFGTDHNELSEAMMLDFFVPRALSEPARHHEAPDESGFDRDSRPQKLACLLHLAYRLCEAAIRDEGKISEETAVINAICGRLGLPEGRVDNVFNESLAEWREWAELLRLPADNARQYEELDFRDPNPSDEESAENPAVRGTNNSAVAAAVVADANITARLSAALSELNIRVETCEKASEAVHLAVDHQVNVFFVTADHTRLIDMIGSAEAGDASYVFVVLEAEDPEREAQAYAEGAEDVIVADISPARLGPRLQPAMRRLKRHERWRSDRKELRRIAKELALAHRQQQVLSLTDQLTELPNRRAGMEALDQAWSSSVRAQAPCALLVLDIDYFKTINDRFGHAVGDQVLRAIASVLKNAVRREETIARIGGEEFLLISPNLSLREAVVAAERLRRQLETAKIDAAGVTVCVTASVGIALREAQMHQAQELMIAADKALYAAKNAGRNRIAVMESGNIRLVCG